MKKTCLISCLCSIMFLCGAMAQSPTPKAENPYYSRDTSDAPLTRKLTAMRYFRKPITEKIEAFRALMKEIPDTGTTAISIKYDVLRGDIAEHYIKDGDKHNSLLWMDSLHTKQAMFNAYVRVGRILLLQDGQQEAARVEQWMQPFVDSMGSQFRKDGYLQAEYESLMHVYVTALVFLGKQDRIAFYLRPLYEADGRSFKSDLKERALIRPEDYKLTDNLSYDYGISLAATGHPKEAMDVLTYLYLNGDEVSETLQAGIKEECWKIPNGKTYFQHVADSIRQQDQAKWKGFVANKIDVDGKPLDVKALKGKYVVIDFWGSWCHPCRASHPHLKELYAKYKEKGLEIIGVSRETAKTPEERRKLWTDAIKEDGLPWLQVMDNVNIEKFNAGDTYAVIAYPTKILIDPDGKVIARYTGAGGAGLTNRLETLSGK